VPLTNLQGYINPEVDRLFTQGRGWRSAMTKPRPATAGLQQILTHDVAMLWMYERKPMLFHNKRLTDVVTGPNGPCDGFRRGPPSHEEAGMKLRYIAARLVKTVLITIAVVLLSFFPDPPGPRRHRHGDGGADGFLPTKPS